jgi:hypothetical protein
MNSCPPERPTKARGAYQALFPSSYSLAIRTNIRTRGANVVRPVQKHVSGYLSLG